MYYRNLLQYTDIINENNQISCHAARVVESIDWAAYSRDRREFTSSEMQRLQLS